MYQNWYDAQHRYRLGLPHQPNNTYDVANNEYVEQDLYWDDDSNQSYEGYMNRWCDLVFPRGTFLNCCAALMGILHLSDSMQVSVFVMCHNCG